MGALTISPKENTFLGDLYMTCALFLELEKEFNLYTKDADSLLYEIRLSDLFTDKGCKQFIDFYGKCIKSLDNKVQSAYFAGYFGMKKSCFCII
ncbi:MAG: hypothetical protein KGZ94_00970 [Clostridia bacterium]|nr:hypothetical protein [Clostridia bacterium]